MFQHVSFPNPRPQSITDWFFCLYSLLFLEFLINGLILCVLFYVLIYSQEATCISLPLMWFQPCNMVRTSLTKSWPCDLLWLTEWGESDDRTVLSLGFKETCKFPLAVLHLCHFPENLPRQAHWKIRKTWNRAESPRLANKLTPRHGYEPPSWSLVIPRCISVVYHWGFVVVS